MWFSGGRDGPGQQLVWDVRSVKTGPFRLLDNLDFNYWVHCNHKCLQMHQILTSSGVWPKCAVFYLLDHHILTKTLALIGGPVNKDFG